MQPPWFGKLNGVKTWTRYPESTSSASILPAGLRC
jgi:hypothetical protein